MIQILRSQKTWTILFTPQKAKSVSDNKLQNQWLQKIAKELKLRRKSQLPSLQLSAHSIAQ